LKWDIVSYDTTINSIYVIKNKLKLQRRKVEIWIKLVLGAYTAIHVEINTGLI
jgi:hypothetical protein